MSVFIPFYVAGVVIPMVFAFFVYLGEGREATRTGARIILLAPIWPLLIPVALTRGVKWLWKTADWRGVEEEEATLRAQRFGRARGW
jgi:hypothetical protein